MEFSNMPEPIGEQPDKPAHTMSKVTKAVAIGTASAAFASLLGYAGYEGARSDVPGAPYTGPAGTVEAGAPIYDGPDVQHECGHVTSSFTAAPESVISPDETDPEILSFYYFGQHLPASSALDHNKLCDEPVIFDQDITFPDE